MRELKFRAWDGRIGQERMLSGMEAIHSSVKLIAYKDHFYLETVNVEKIILMQSTGLKDKNGKDIYEGDILKYQIIESTPRLAEVTYLDGIFCLKNDMAMPVRYYNETGEVIGNVHENPELLTKDTHNE